MLVCPQLQVLRLDEHDHHVFHSKNIARLEAYP